MKKRGALLAKGRLLGVQFDALFTDGLYMKISSHAITLAEKMKKILLDSGYELFIDSPTNQQFPIIENKKLKELSKCLGYSFWEKKDEDHTVIRLATAWSTTDDEIEELKRILN